MSRVTLRNRVGTGLMRVAAGMVVWATVVAAWAQNVPVVEKTFSNGMRVLLLERHDEPRVAGGWVAHVGSVNERPGITGIAHLFEHMMFKGTPTLGTKDFERDKVILAEQERVRGLMREEEARMRAMLRRGEIDDLQKPENKTPRMQELEKEFQKLVEQQREVLVKNEFDRVYTSAGAAQMNAFTTHDLTAYHIIVPANKIELWMWMESERLLRPVFREFYAERDVVFEERRMRVESTPLGKFQESFDALFWESHPYNWPVIGWPSDIPAISKADADEFYALFYSPQNITLVLVGDLKVDEVVPMLEKYFGRIPRGQRPPPEMVTLEVPQTAEKRMSGEAEANPQVDMVWHTVPFGHKDAYALDVLSQVLSERTGRLYKGLVLGRKVATEVSARHDNRKYAGMLNIWAEAAEGKTLAEVEAAIDEELERLKTEPVPAQELQKVKNYFAAYEYRKLNSNYYILLQLLYYDGFGNWREINEAGPKVQAVTAEDIQRVAGKYLVKINRAVATYTRKAGAATDDPELAGLSPEQKPVIRQIIAALQGEKDVARLKTGLQGLEAQAAKADPKRQEFLRIYRKKVQERIAELEKGGAR